MRYVQREPDAPRKVTAAQYRVGTPLDDVLAVAQTALGTDAKEDADWGVLLLRVPRLGEDFAVYSQYEVLEDGDWLVFRYDIDGLFVLNDAEFRTAYQPEPA